MSKETSEWLNQNTLIGFTDKRGQAWHYRASDQGDEPNHYTGAVPVDDVRRRLFHWQPVEGPVISEFFAEDGYPISVTDESRKTIIRPDTRTILGIFKQGYQVHGYDQWLVENVEAILDASSGDLQIGSAGLLKGGAVAWVQFELEETQEVCGVQYRPFLTAATSLDGSLATTYKMGGQLVVCDNTLSAELASKGESFKVKHSRRSIGRLSEVRDALGIVFQVNDSLADEIEALTSVYVSDAEWDRFLDQVAKVDPEASKRSQTMAENKREALTGLWNRDERANQWRNTAWGVVAAMNTYEHHFATVRNAGRAERNMLNMVTGATEKADADVLATLALVTT